MGESETSQSHQDPGCSVYNLKRKNILYPDLLKRPVGKLETPSCHTSHPDIAPHSQEETSHFGGKELDNAANILVFFP